ncbi:MAG: glycosyltransferase family 39 protein [Anaerolineae bacterium]|nr:glycosyltransferase family 39 protein [Anaerolineae bacterium]
MLDISQAALKQQTVNLGQIKVTPYKVLILLITISAALCLLRFNAIPVGAYFDDAHYIILSESLAAGTGYRLINSPSAPIEEAFPPGWPILLTPFATLFPENYTVLKLLSLIFWLGCIPLMYLLFRARLQPIHTIAVVALAVVNSSLIGMSGTVMSEPAYLFLSLSTLVLFDLWQQGERYNRVWLLILIVLAAFYTLMIRTIGITLLGALLLYLIFKYRRFILPTAGVLLLVLVPLTWFNYRNGGALVFSPLYYEHVRYVLSNMIEFVQFWKYASYFSVDVASNALIPVFGSNFISKALTPNVSYWLGVSLLAFTAFGYFISLHRFKVMDLYVALYFIIFYIWVIYTAGTDHQTRLIIPMIPFLYFYLLQAALWCVNSFLASSTTYKSVLVVAFVIMIMMISLVLNYREVRLPVYDRVTYLPAGNQWLRENTSSDAIVLSPNGMPNYLYSRRRTEISGPGIIDIQQYVEDKDIDYILIQPHLYEWDTGNQLDEYTSSTLLPYLVNHPTNFKQVYEDLNHNVKVFQVMPLTD